MKLFDYEYVRFIYSKLCLWGGIYMMLHYFISGIILEKGGYTKKYFNAEVPYFRRITSIEDIVSMQKRFAQTHNISYEEIVILNYTLLRTE